MYGIIHIGFPDDVIYKTDSEMEADCVCDAMNGSREPEFKVVTLS